MRRTTPRVSEARAEFIRQRFARSGSTGQRYAYKSLLDRFAASVNDRQIGTLTAGNVEDFFYGAGGLSDTCQASTLASHRNNLKAFFGFCHRRGYTALHPDLLLGGVHEKSTRSRRIRQQLSATQLLSLLDAANDDRDRALAAFVMNTAVRISEALAVRVGDVDLSAGSVRVEIIKTREWDVMPVTVELERELRAWLTTYANKLATRPLKKTDYLFPARNLSRFGPGGTVPVRGADNGYNPERPIHIPSRIMTAIAGRAGIELEPGDGWHTVRRSVARIYFDAASSKGHDAALRETAALLHHKNTKTTELYLGLELEKRNRDAVLRGQTFLSSLVSEANIVPLDKRREA